jgi:transposase
MRAPGSNSWTAPKRHLLVGGKGTPLAVRLTGANRNESLEAMNLVDDIPPIRGRRGRPRRKPKALYGDRQYGTPRNREGLKARRIEDHLARQRTPHGSGLGKVRWVVERAFRLGRASPPAENPVRQVAVDPSRLSPSTAGQDLLHDPARGFLLEFLISPCAHFLQQLTKKPASL